MKTSDRRHPNYVKKLTITGIFILLIFSCSKNTDTPTDITAHYCGTIDWKNTLGTSGTFKGGILNGQYGLLSVEIKDDGSDTFHTFHRTNNTNVILNDQLGYAFTYDAGNIVKLVTADGTGTGTATFNFDTKSHLTSSDIENSDQTGTESLKFTYTYDKNDDPIKIVGHLVSTSSEGTSTADYDISADYLTDKVNFLPLVPEMTPYTILFSYSWFLSRHLINKWVIKINGTTEQGVAIPQINFTQQYTYTYDTNGNVSTMVHTGNSKNIFTFTYSGCN